MTIEMYSETILHYYENPPNKKRIAKANYSAKLANPLCGDDVTVFLKTNSKGVVEEASFEGQGCAISQASTSMLLEKLEGKSVLQAKKTSEKEVLKALGVSVSPARLKCALLGLEAGLQNF